MVQGAWAHLFWVKNCRRKKKNPAGQQQQEKRLPQGLTAALFCVSYVLLENCFSTFFFNII